MSPYPLSEQNMHMVNLAHGSLDHATEHGQVMG